MFKGSADTSDEPIAYVKSFRNLFMKNTESLNYLVSRRDWGRALNGLQMQKRALRIHIVYGRRRRNEFIVRMSCIAPSSQSFFKSTFIDTAFQQLTGNFESGYSNLEHHGDRHLQTAILWCCRLLTACQPCWDVLNWTCTIVFLLVLTKSKWNFDCSIHKNLLEMLRLKFITQAITSKYSIFSNTISGKEGN